MKNQNLRLFKENNKFMNVLEIKERLIYIKSLIDESNLDEELLSSLSNELEELEEELKSLF